MAMFIALQIILSKFLMLQLSGSIRLSIDSVPILLAGIWFGPIAGGIVGAFSDLLGTLLFPTAGAYYPPLTIAFFLIGFVAGLLSVLTRKMRSVFRISLIVVPSEIAGSLLFKSYALSLLIGKSFSAILAGRALYVVIVMIVNAILVTTLDRMLGAKATREKDLDGTGVELPIRTVDTHLSAYDDALRYIHHVTWRGSKLGLERTRALLDKIGNPHRKLKFVHIAGTNGKGSTAAMLANTLSLAGYRTGLYISPYITRFNERVQINGVPISDEELAEITAYIRPFADALPDHPTEFELITVIAFEYFYRHETDIVALEVGLGGDLDSTNVIGTPELAVITSIGLDHTRELGPTISDIARAKAGIIKNGGDVVICDQNADADEVFQSACRERGATLHITGHDRMTDVSASLDALRFTFSPYGEMTCGLIGTYQTKNAAVAITVLEILQSKGWAISVRNIRDGIASVRWPARFEVLKYDPLFIADGGHNPQGIAAVADSLKTHFPDRKITFLIGFMADKDLPQMIDLLSPLAREFITVTPYNPRAISAVDLADLMREKNLPATPCQSVSDGVQLSIERAGKDGIVCAIGSLYMLGDVRAQLGISE